MSFTKGREGTVVVHEGGTVGWADACAGRLEPGEYPAFELWEEEELYGVSVDNGETYGLVYAEGPNEGEPVPNYSSKGILLTDCDTAPDSWSWKEDK